MQEKLIDVSTWNGNIDWDKVYKSGVRYAMIRSSFGVENPNQIDNKFVRNITNAVRAGVKCQNQGCVCCLSEVQLLQEVSGRTRERHRDPPFCEKCV